MWPWEHLAVAYLAYSGAVRLWAGRSPRDQVAVAALAIGTLFPDLVDKPLAWTFGVLPSGSSFAHSVLVAVPVVVVVVAVTWRRGRPAVGIAFAIGYLLHLPSDALYASVVLGATVEPGSYLWPLVPAPPTARPGFGANVAHYFERYVMELTRPGRGRFLAAEILLLASAFGLWLRDGAPGLGLLAPSDHREPVPADDADR